MPGESSLPRIALICPSKWDRLQLPRIRERLGGRFLIEPYGPDAEADPASFDADAFVERAVVDLAPRGFDAVTSSSDYPGCLVAALIAERLGLHGCSPESVLRTSHKFYARKILARAVPEATPAFALIDPDRMDESGLGLPFPMFVKPVKSWFSQHAELVESFGDLVAFAAQPSLRRHLVDFVRPFNQLLSRYAGFEFDGGKLIGEDVLHGRQVTLEGYVLDETVGLVGIVDSIMYPATNSFRSFVYPSAVSSDVLARMTELAARAVRGLGLSWTMFNIELIDNPQTGSIHIVEVNPRMCGQFADLMEAVNGVNTYEIMFDVALGRRPTIHRPDRSFSAAASFPRRRFSDGTVVAVPSADHLARVQREFGASLIAIYYRAGQRLSSVPKHFDGASYRYATINLASLDASTLDFTADSIERELGIEIIGDG